MTDYAEYLQSPEWAQIRARVLARDDYRCQDCGRGCDLHVHHLTYEDVGSEHHWQLITLCETCHFDRHANSFQRAWNGATWDERGSATEWRNRNWTKTHDWEESFYAEALHGDFGGDDRADAAWLSELIDRDT